MGLRKLIVRLFEKEIRSIVRQEIARAVELAKEALKEVTKDGGAYDETSVHVHAQASK